MAFCPNTLNEETFPAFWKYVRRKYRQSRKRAVIRNASVPIAQVLYFFVFLVFVYGAACSMIPGAVHRYLSEIPAMVDLWKDFEAFYFAPAATETHRLILSAAALYLVPFAVAAVPAILICLLYHPRMPKQMGESVHDAQELRTMAKHADVYAKRKEPNTVNICAAFFGMLITVAVLGYLLYSLANPTAKQQVIEEAHTANVRLFLYAAAAFFAYRILNFPLHFLLKLLHFCHIPKQLVPVTEAYYQALPAAEETPANNS